MHPLEHPIFEHPSFQREGLTEHSRQTLTGLALRLVGTTLPEDEAPPYQPSQPGEPGRYMRDFVIPGIEEAMEFDEASRLKKFGAAMRAISLLLGPPQGLSTMASHHVSTAPESAQVVKGSDEQKSLREKPPIVYKPPQKKVSATFTKKPTK